MLDLILFTHNDMDGYGCKLVADVTMALAKNNNYEVIICSSGSVDHAVHVNFDPILEKIGPNTVVVFSDIVPSEGCLTDLLIPSLECKMIKDIHVYDHHDSNMYVCESLHERAHMYVDDGSPDKDCGASLLYRAFSQYIFDRGFDTDNIDTFIFSKVIDLIRLYDTYEWKILDEVDAKKLNILFSMIGGDNFCKKYFDRIMKKDSSGLIFTPTELEFIDAKLKYVTDVINRVTPDDFTTVLIRNRCVALLTKGIAASINEIADKFLESFPEYDAIIHLSTFGNWQFAIRTRKDGINAAKIFAEPLGGGGHPKACGCPVPDFIKKAIIDTAIRYLNGDDVGMQVYTKYESEGNNNE